jgi:SH3-like domain-containing protein
VRAWGRITDELGNKTWVEVTTDSNGLNDAVNVTWLAQALKLNLNESPFWGNWGIPQYQTVMTQVYPTYYVMQTQTRFQGLFAALQISQIQGAANPSYNVNATLHNGAQISVEIPT